MRGDSLPKRWNCFHILSRIPTPALTEGKFCTAKRTHMAHARPSVGPAKFDVNRCNGVARGRKPDFWPVSKFNTGSLPLRGNPAAGNNVIVQRNYQYVGIGHCYCHYTITLSFSLVYHLGLASSSMALSSTGFFIVPLITLLRVKCGSTLSSSQTSSYGVP